MRRLLPPADSIGPSTVGPTPRPRRNVATQDRSTEIDLLDERIKLLRIEYERFFNCDLDIPPEDVVEEIRRAIRLLRNQRKSNVDNFRLQALEARFSAYSEMFMRRQRTLERKGGQRRTSTAPAPVVDLSDGIVFGESFDKDRTQPLYRRLYQDGNRKPVDPDAFATYLANQHKLIREKTGCTKVRFRIVEEDGKAKLKAKAERS